jgi:hypothetical protein
MAKSLMLECQFFVPLNRDGILSDGLPHETTAWEWLEDELLITFDGLSVTPGLFRGAYRDPDTGERVNDESRQFIVALSMDRLDELRVILQQACTMFQQKCIYLSVAGQVEFVKYQP